MTEQGRTTRRRFVGTASSLGLAGSAGCLRLTNEDGATTASETTLDGTAAASEATADGTATNAGTSRSSGDDASTRDATSTTRPDDGASDHESVRPVAYDWDSEAQLADWSVESTGDAFTRVTVGSGITAETVATTTGAGTTCCTIRSVRTTTSAGRRR